MTATADRKKEAGRQQNLTGGARDSRKTRIRNRRKRYLDLHGNEYLGASLESADYLLYDRLIRRYQSAAEREAEGRQKGWSGILEADMRRAEAKSEDMRNSQHASPFACRREPDGEILAEDQLDKPANKEEARAWWLDEMTQRFLRGDDADFNYHGVDENEEYDDLAEEEREAQEKWFDEQEPEFILKDGEMPVGQTGIQDY